MINDFERYHGVVLRDIIVKAGEPVTISATAEAGRVNTFLLNSAAVLHIKHSSKRLPPWQFTFTEDNIRELAPAGVCGLPVWLGLVCGQDGVVALTWDEFRQMNPPHAPSTCFVRVDRDRNKMYRLNGTGGKLNAAKPHGMSLMLASLKQGVQKL